MERIVDVSMLSRDLTACAQDLLDIAQAIEEEQYEDTADIDADVQERLDWLKGRRKRWGL